ncbi:MAG: PepSY-associated TM helix domain-containing protein [Polyangiales bacterium]
MKLSARTFKIQWDVHAWAGVITSVFLFVVFYCGVFALYNAELSRWQDPSTHDAPARDPRSFGELLAELHRRIEIPDGARIELNRGDETSARVVHEPSDLDRQVSLSEPPDVTTADARASEPAGAISAGVPSPAPVLGASTLLTTQVREPDGDRDSSAANSGSLLTADPEDHAEPEEPPEDADEDEDDNAHSRLAEELYVMHFFYRVPHGIEFAGVVAVAFFVALVSGLVIHLKDFKRQLWQFRPQLRVRFSSSDAHKVLGVFGLPFAAMYAWSGAVLGLFGLIGMPILYGVYTGDEAALGAERDLRAPEHVPAGHTAPMRPLDELVAQATSLAAGSGKRPAEPLRLEIDGYRDAHAAVGVFFRRTLFASEAGFHFDAVSGALVRRSGQVIAPSEQVENVLFDLHYARFGGHMIKALYGLLALAVCAVILTGNLIWVERRDAQRAQAGHRWLERLTVSISFGLIVGVAGYFVANRALPDGMTRRADLEFALFLALWGASSLLALLPRLSPRSCAVWLSGAAAALFGLVSVTDALTQRVHLWNALARDNVPVFVAEVLIAAMAVAAGVLAWRLRRGSSTRQVATR